MASEPTTITSVERAVAVVRAVAGADRGLGVSEIARRCGLPKSTTVRLLHTLETLDLVERTTTSGGYRVGVGVQRLATGTPAPGQLRDVARPALRTLVSELGEDASLAVPDGDQLLYVGQVTAGQAVQVPDWSGQRMPYHVAAAGYVLMAAIAPDVLDRVLAPPLEAFAADTCTDPDELRRRVEVARVDGFAWVRDEWAEGITGIAAPVHDDSGRLVAAVNVHGPSFRFPGERGAADVQRRVTAAAAGIDARSAQQPRDGA
jgi:IclR family transcriptional regulator, acetate operon repressor